MDIPVRTRILGIGGIETMPRGQTEHLKEEQYKVRGDRPLAKSPISVRLPEDIDEIVRSLPNKSAWLQQVITNAITIEIAEDRTPS